MEHTLVRGDVRRLDAPLHAQSLSLIAGVVLAVIIDAACVVLAFVGPSGAAAQRADRHGSRDRRPLRACR
jgi:Type VII secretion system ESX-1, transport TM domain B